MNGIIMNPPYCGLGESHKYLHHEFRWKQLQNKVHLKTKSPKEKWFQNHLYAHPELLGRGWKPFAKERSLKTILKKLGIELDRSNYEGMEGRPDLVFEKDNIFLVVEIMRPKDPVDDDHVERIHTYQAFLAGSLDTYKVKGVLIADPPYHRGVKQKLDNLSNQILFLTWLEFLEQSKPEFRFERTLLLGHAFSQIAGLLPPSQSSVCTIATS